MALSDIDRSLLQRCLTLKSGAWEDFVDRFLGLVVHVINHTAQSRSVRLNHQDCEDLSAEVFLTLLKDDFAVLRRFRGEASLASYLTVVARRIVVHHLLRSRKEAARLTEPSGQHADAASAESAEQRIGNREEVERLLSALKGSEAEVVRMYHLEGKSYQEISSQVGMPENSVGPTLTRARAKMRGAATDSARN